IFVGIRTGLVLALITMVTSEMIARQAGVGSILFNALDMAQYASVYAMIVIIGGLGVILDLLFEGLRAQFVAWAEPRHDIAGGARLKAERPWRVGLALLPPACLVAVWHGIAVAGLAPAALLPLPSAVFARLLQQLHNPLFLQHAATTLFRLFAGFAIAVVVGVG